MLRGKAGTDWDYFFTGVWVNTGRDESESDWYKSLTSVQVNTGTDENKHQTSVSLKSEDKKERQTEIIFWQV